MMPLSLVLLASVGLTFVLCSSHIMKPLRNVVSSISFFKNLFSCYGCMGVHTGWFLYILVYAPYRYVVEQWLTFAIETLVFSLGSAALCYTANVVWLALESAEQYLGSISENEEGDRK